MSVNNIICRKRKKKNSETEKKVKKVYFENGRRFGSYMIKGILDKIGFNTNEKTVEKICKEYGLVSITLFYQWFNIKLVIDRFFHIFGTNAIKNYNENRKFLRHEKNVYSITGNGYEKIKNAKEKISSINQVWLCDWTRFFVMPGYVMYVCLIKDKCSGMIIDYEVTRDGENVDTQIKVLKNALKKRNVRNDLVLQTDNDITFRDKRFLKLVSQLLKEQKFNDRIFSIAENAIIESCFATIKKEWYYPHFFYLVEMCDIKNAKSESQLLYRYNKIHEIQFEKLTLENFESGLSEYIDYYNNRRAHEHLGFLSPREYEESISVEVPEEFNRIIMHVDINACFAQLERIFDKTLLHKNLVVIGEEYKRNSIIVCASYEARKYNIDCGDSLKYARAKCHDLVVRKSNKKKYAEFTKKFFRTLYYFSDKVEPYGIDEAWLDVTDTVHLYGTKENLAECIMERLKSELGLTVSIGISFNKVFAKLATDMHKPNKMTEIPYSFFRKIVWDQKVENLLFVGEARRELFNLNGIYTIGDLAVSNVDDISWIVGRKIAERLILYANGRDYEKVKHYGVQTQVKSITRGDTTYKNIKTCAEFDKEIARHAEDLAYTLRENEFKTYGIMLKIKNAKCKEYSMQMTLKRGIDDGYDIKVIAQRLYLKRFLKNVYDANFGFLEIKTKDNIVRCEDLPDLGDIMLYYNSPLYEDLREISISAYNLVKVENTELQLFNDTKRDIVNKAVDKLTKKYGKKVVYNGVLAENWADIYYDLYYDEHYDKKYH